MVNLGFNRINPIGDSPHHGRDDQNKRKKPKKDEEKQEEKQENPNPEAEEKNPESTKDSFEISKEAEEQAPQQAQGATLEWLNLQKQANQSNPQTPIQKPPFLKKPAPTAYKQEESNEDKKSFEA